MALKESGGETRDANDVNTVLIYESLKKVIDKKFLSPTDICLDYCCIHST